jgi:2'-5' RNA ligase
MPYTNVPPGPKQQKMERCVQQVMADGHDQQTAIAICYTSIVGKKEDAPAPAHTGVMVAFFLAPDQAEALALGPEALPAGATPLPPAELHLTLALLGETTDQALAARKNELLLALALFARQAPPLAGKVGGVGRFTADEGNGMSAFYASFDSPDIQAWRAMLVAVLEGAGFPSLSNHGFTPHITLAYVPASADLPAVAPNLTLAFESVALAWGDEVTRLPLAVVAAEAVADDEMAVADSVPPTDDPAPEGLASRIKAALLARRAAYKAEAGDDGGPARSSSGSSSSGSQQGGSRSGYNWGARAGQVIRGRLARGADGRFTSTGSATASTATTTSTPDRRRNYNKPEKTKKPASGGGKKTGQGSRGGKTDAQREAEKKKRQQEQEAKRAQRKAEAEAEKKKREQEREAKRAQREAEREAKRQEREANKKPAGGGKGGGGGKADQEAKREEREAKAKKKKIYEAIDKVGEGETLTSAEKKLLLDEGLITENADGTIVLTDKGKRVAAEEAEDDKQKEYRVKALSLALKQAMTRRAAPAAASFAVFKQADGRHRWVGFSSNAFRDRDGEIVSTRALVEDVQRADADGRLGPLRWWHVGDPDPTNLEAPWGPGLDLGWCDYSAVQDRVLIESGTFSDETVGAAVAAKAADLQLSIGFLHPPGEPDAEGVFHHIRRFERSLLPAGRAANPFTRLSVHKEEATVLQEKWKGFVALFGGNEETAREYVNQAALTQKAAETAGVAFKAKAEPEPEPDAAPPAEETPTEAKAEGEEEMAEGGAEMVYVSDLTVDEFIEMFAGALAPVLEALDIETKMGARLEEVKAAMGGLSEEMKGLMGGYTKKKDDEAAALAARLAQVESALKESGAAHAQTAQTLAAVAGDLAATKALATELAGETPAAARGYLASQADETVLKDNHRLKGAGPARDGNDTFDWFVNP